MDLLEARLTLSLQPVDRYLAVVCRIVMATEAVASSWVERTTNPSVPTQKMLCGCSR